jgi:type I site-specific restriction endonuclease
LLTNNQNPEQLARNHIDALLIQSGWLIQNKSSINLSATKGIAIREYQTDVGPADYILFVNKKPVGVIEAKREDEGVRLTMHEDQTSLYKINKQQIVQEIGSRLSVCDEIEETITTILKQAEALRQSILKKAFEGKLV